MNTFGYNPILNAMAERNRQFDGIKEAVEQVQFDPISERQALVETANMRMAAVSIVLTLAMIVSEEQDADEEELLPSEVLDGLMLNVFEQDDDEEIDEMVKIILSAHVADFLKKLGVGKDLIDEMFSADFDLADNAFDLADNAIEKACQIILDNLPEDGKPLDDFINNFAYGDDNDDESKDEGYDAVKLSVGQKSTKEINGKKARYQAKRVVKNGEVVIKNERIGGNVRLSAKQRASLKKAQRKAQTGSAIKKRVRSFMKGARMGLHDN